MVAAVKQEQAILIVHIYKKICVRFTPSPQSQHSVCFSFLTFMFALTSNSYLIKSSVLTHSDDVSLETVNSLQVLGMCFILYLQYNMDSDVEHLIKVLCVALSIYERHNGLLQ